MPRHMTYNLVNQMTISMTNQMTKRGFHGYCDAGRSENTPQPSPRRD